MFDKFTAKQLFFGGLIAPFIFGLVIIGAFFVKGSIPANAEADHIQGNKDSQIKVIVYSDFQCPFSGKFYPTFKQLVQTYGKKVSFEFKHFPLNFHQYAEKTAEASECANDQGKFWQFHDKDFENQTSLNLDTIQTWAKQIGLNMTKFNACLDSGKYASKVQADLDEGKNKGVSGTPTIFINEQKIVGAQPYQNFQSEIDKLIK